MKKVFIYFITTLFAVSTLSASVVLGNFELVKGSVKIKPEDTFKKSNASKGLEIKKGDLITTSKESNAIIKLQDGSTLILDESSTLHFASKTLASQEEGKIYYNITSRDAKNALKVKTPFAIIGIKGTTFIVDTNKTSSVKLKEGLVGIQSLKEEFELYRKQVQADYKDYLSEQEKEYQKFLNEQNKGAVLITKEFDLQEKNTITFDGQKVSESAWTEEDDAEFERFEALMESLK
ncbi:MAG: FecR family protein [Sulfurimonas sp.]|uniref:FecR family protein n=1 Tax=Sulfurimonas sp. TaxID=2022749 RepID=UPI0025F0C9D6|nr:FecR family protein [Sulfurimonas sp.]MCK9492493.1 FecR family protein [Sulfurimonas sp.]